MPTTALFLFLLLVAAPIGLALWQGERLVNALTDRRRRGRSRKRRRAIRALPVREDVIQSLLDAEAGRERLEDRIAETLAAFGRVTVDPVDVTGAEAALAEIEQAVLHRESMFGDYLDCAWLQSEAIELLDREVTVLRDFADVTVPPAVPDRPARREHAPSRARETDAQDSAAADPAHAAGRDRTPSPAQARLLATLESAARRRADVDRRLTDLKAPADPPPRSPGSRVDFTIGDEGTGES